MILILFSLFIFNFLTIHAVTNPSEKNKEISLWQDPASVPSQKELILISQKAERKKWMIAFKYLHQAMNGNLKGTKNISSSEIFDLGFNVAPTKMPMDKYILNVMYRLVERVSLMASFPYIVNSMDHETRSGGEFTTKSSGLGDIIVKGIFTLYNQRKQLLFLETGLSFPSGSVNKRDDNPAGKNQLLAYPMQTGSGTYDIIFSFYYYGLCQKWFWGVYHRDIIRTGKNKKGYTFGNQIQLNAWLGNSIFSEMDIYIGLNGLIRGNVRGMASELNPSVFPLANSNFQKRKRIDLFLGTHISGRGRIKNLLLKFEAYLPIYQNLTGPQLKTSWLIQAFLSLKL